MVYKLVNVFYVYVLVLDIRWQISIVLTCDVWVTCFFIFLLFPYCPILTCDTSNYIFNKFQGIFKYFSSKNTFYWLFSIKIAFLLKLIFILLQLYKLRIQYSFSKIIETDILVRLLPSNSPEEEVQKISPNVY